MLQARDGFDHYTSLAALQLKYPLSPAGSGFSIVSPGRYGSGALQMIDSGRLYTVAAKPLAGRPTTIICGMAIKKIAAAPGVPILTLGDDAASAIVGDASSLTNGNGYIAIDSNARLTYFLGNRTLIATQSGGTLLTGQWNYIEFKVALASTAAGSIQLRVNGSLVASETGLVTSSSNAYATHFSWCSESQSQVDDFYMLDDTNPSGFDPCDFLGDIKILTSFPNGAGRVNQWTRVGGTSAGNFTAINDANPDGDTSYILDGNSGDIDCSAMSALPGNVSKIYALGIVATAEKDDAGSLALGLGVGDGSSESFDAGTGLPSSYVMIERNIGFNPLTNAALTPAAVEAFQAAVKVI